MRPNEPLPGDDARPSGVFLMPGELHVPAFQRRESREHARFKIWLALGLAATSILTGSMYYLYYLRVGNPITALLPRDTVAYVRVGRAGSLKEAFHNLEMWTNTRPVRGAVREQERLLLSRLLLDVGINAGLLERLEDQVDEAHLAVLAAERQVTGTLPYDALLFLKVTDRQLHQELLSRVAPYFDVAGSEAGVDIAVRGAGPTAMSFATFDRWVVLCWGGDGPLRDVLRARERGPSHSLNDAPGFRTAFRASAHDSEMWAYVRHDHLANYIAHQWVGPRLDETARRALEHYAELIASSGLEGIGLAVDMRAGIDAGVLGFYGGDLDDIAEQTGVREKRSLSTIPQTAIFAVAASIADPVALFQQWRGPLLELLRDFHVFDDSRDLGGSLNWLQAESGVHLSRDVWPRLAGELAVALVPRADGPLDWMVVLHSHHRDELSDMVSRVGKHLFRPKQTRSGRIRYRYGYSGGLHSWSRIEERPGPSSLFEAVGSEDVLCWAEAGSHLVLGSSCDVVSDARAAESSGAGIGQLPAVIDALARLPERNTAVVIGRLAELTSRLQDRPSITSELLAEHFLAAATITIEEDRVEFRGNVSLLSVGFVAAAGHLDSTPIAESDHCRELTNALCSTVPRDACREYEAIVAGNSGQACETGLRTLRAFEVQ